MSTPGAGYNYETFPIDLDAEAFRSFPSVLTAGESAPDGPVIDAADGRELPLSELWRGGRAVLEFGSIT